MDHFVETVQSQCFLLNAWDLASAFTNIPYIYYYKNTENSLNRADFMPSGRLREAFFRTLEEFPILAGRISTGNDGRTFVCVDSVELNMPEYIETQSQTHFRQLEKMQFAWNSLPECAATVGAFPTRGCSGVLKLANVNIIRLKDNSGLVMFISIPHYVMDGVGYCAFVNRWAEVCSWIRSGLPTADLPTRTFSFNRSIIEHSLPEKQTPLYPAMHKIYNTPRYIGSILAKLSPELRGDILVGANCLVDATGCLFHVSRSSLDKLHYCVSGGVSSGKQFSDNDILTALISYVTSCAMQECANKPIKNGIIKAAAKQIGHSLVQNSSEFLTMLVLDIRPRLKGLKQAQYTGNCVTCIPITTKMKKIAEANISFQTLAAICTNVRSTVCSTDGELLSKLHDVLHSHSASHTNALVNAMIIQKKIVLSNQSRFSLYQNDFGNGIPMWVSPISIFYSNFASILPVHPESNGYNIYLTVESCVMKQLQQNLLWTKYVASIY
ncbi:hypothetical protein COEREDRAFT_83033 [Coemansia reversa NRRL 1564]|uniref:Transferase-domain-containing protein n=1 Tax=Coemansia reversa (strain ATCC 12441 / NRRL 1564) TaxID=763665 RepID=A0A2G5B4P9_COERN|nr:hypothetical protein COEREDRAFT_83033 [Coemansia reversa NRRL 1564]|eukprot:PIA13972.1 hypothetical protein COEREDRAFT_83033 [Coemansia reversa NRRL 1564]